MCPSSPSPGNQSGSEENTKPLPVIWITGCANGVGAQLVESALERGFKVWATDIDLDGLKARSVDKKWPLERVFLRQLDVSSGEQWRAVFDELMVIHGRLDVMVNNAGVIKPGFLLDAPEESLDLHLNVNLKGVILGSQTACRHMVIQGSGHVVNIASLAGVAPIPGLGYYSVSKFGVRAYSLILAEEMAESGVKVSVLCPDVIKTAMYDLQLDYPDEAALTFSGGKPLTVEMISDCLFDQILPDAPLEVMVPATRGWLAKTSNFFPRISHLVGTHLRKKGRTRILAERDKGKADKTMPVR